MSTPPTESAPYVFLSYASVDREAAFRIADALEANGVGTWVDRRSIAPGSHWSAEIVRGIRGCRAVLVLCSSAALGRLAHNSGDLDTAGQRYAATISLLETTPDAPLLTLALFQGAWFAVDRHQAEVAGELAAAAAARASSGGRPVPTALAALHELVLAPARQAGSAADQLVARRRGAALAIAQARELIEQIVTRP